MATQDCLPFLAAGSPVPTKARGVRAPTLVRVAACTKSAVVFLPPFTTVAAATPRGYARHRREGCGRRRAPAEPAPPGGPEGNDAVAVAVIGTARAFAARLRRPGGRHARLLPSEARCGPFAWRIALSNAVEAGARPRHDGMRTVRRPRASADEPCHRLPAGETTEACSDARQCGGTNRARDRAPPVGTTATGHAPSDGATQTRARGGRAFRWTARPLRDTARRTSDQAPPAASDNPAEASSMLTPAPVSLPRENHRRAPERPIAQISMLNSMAPRRDRPRAM